MHVGYAVDAVVEESKRIILGRSGNKNTSTAQMMLASTIAGKLDDVPVSLVPGSIQNTESLVGIRCGYDDHYEPYLVDPDASSHTRGRRGTSTACHFVVSDIF
jgi:hypothetical protein